MTKSEALAAALAHAVEQAREWSGHPDPETVLGLHVGVRPKGRHIYNPHCWCAPELHYVDAQTGAHVYLHRRLQ